MEVIVMESETFKQIIERLENLEAYFKHIAKIQPLSQNWLDVNETCKLFKISKRTLQNYREEGLITYSQKGSKIYFSAKAIEEFLENHSYKAFRKPKIYV
ncbi:MAG: helix-turn-helix domain-containing protein [Bacteroidetes bacterium]|nr:helix-turn-helix domain-containing protein [Bacteroidota bacterium]